MLSSRKKLKRHHMYQLLPSTIFHVLNNVAVSANFHHFDDNQVLSFFIINICILVLLLFVFLDVPCYSISDEEPNLDNT